MQQTEKFTDSYQDIFELRADTYHEAMTLCPSARAPEFEALVSFADLQPDSVIADIPSGGGYLEHYISDVATAIVAIEPTEQFYQRCMETPRLKKILSPLESVPAGDQTIDAVLSLAGLHHVVDRAAVFREFRRILRPDGILCIGDVPLGSGVDGFLNTFVHQHNSLGHEGWFIDEDFRQKLRNTGFVVEANEVIQYSWNFVDADEMVRFCMLLFGIDKATPEEVRSGIEQHLGYSADDTGCQMSWELEFLRCSPAR